MLSGVENIPRHQRDQYILKLRKRGYTVRQIAKAVGLSSSGVHAAIDRLNGNRVDEDVVDGMVPDDDAE